MLFGFGLAVCLCAGSFPANLKMDNLQDERSTLLGPAMSAARAAIPAAESDPSRPVFHFRPPALWMNDPNGPIYYRGWYHVFYQFNPYGDQWGHMHWGHARSKDLVNWEHLPIALWPTKSKGEDHIYSGSSFLDGAGKPRIFYTSISGQRPPEQWSAVPLDRDLLQWDKPDSNPVVSEATFHPAQIGEWRDPFIFSEGGHTYMLTGGMQDGHGIVPIFRAIDAELTKWEFRGVFFQHRTTGSVECPNIAKVGNKWVLFVSVEGRVEAHVGVIDDRAMRFTSEHEQPVLEGAYASQLMPKPNGDHVYLGWVQMNNHRGWNGTFSLPSDLGLMPDGRVVTKPIPALQKLRGAKTEVSNFDLQGSLDLSDRVKGNTVEVLAEIDPGTASVVRIELSSTATITFDVLSRTLQIPHRRPMSIRQAGPLKLHLFLDRTVMDVYADDYTQAQTSSIELGDPSKGLRILADGGMARIRSLTAYELKPARFDLSRFH